MPQIEEMRESDKRMREFKAELEERQSEVEELRQSLTSKGSEVERMNTDTSLYKQQYTVVC